MTHILDIKTILKAGASAAVLMLIIGIFDLYDLVGNPPINDLLREAPDGLRGNPGSNNSKVATYVITWLALTFLVMGVMYYLSERKRRKNISGNA